MPHNYNQNPGACPGSIKNYVQEAKNARAVCRMVSWLTAVGIPHKTGDGINHDLIVQNKNGVDTPVKVTMGGPATNRSGLSVRGVDLISNKQDVYLKAFHFLTKNLGYGKPMPVNRGPVTNRPYRYTNDFELVAFRHREFRKSPNPDPEEFDKYKTVINSVVDCTWRAYINLFKRHGLERSDLKTYVQVWVTNYLGLYKVAHETQNDNIRKMRAYLRQRFIYFRVILNRKERSSLVDQETANVALFGRSFDFKTGPFYEAPAEAESPNPAQHYEIDTTTDTARRRTAKIALETRLLAMPHDKMVKTLEEAAHNTFINPGAKREASKRLLTHRKQCKICSKLKELP
jgi:hypothetical protein